MILKKMTESEIRKLVVNHAEKYLGISEGSEKHKSIIKKMNHANPDKYDMKITDPWCACFASVILIEVFGEETALKEFPLSVGCPKIITKAKKLKMWKESDSHTPKPADLILYDWEDTGAGDNKGNPDHVGIVVSVNNGNIKVIEGNKSNTVGYRTIKLDGKYIRGFVTPDYSKYAAEKKKAKTGKTNTTIAKEVIRGEWGNGAARKKALTAAGYDYNAIQALVNDMLS